MDSSAWIALLCESADNICLAIEDAKSRGVGMETRSYKHLLDEAAQTALVETLYNYGISARLISEEGNVIVGTGGPTIIADPIDGTTNLARSLRPAMTCLSVSDNGLQSGTIAAVVKDVYTGDVYIAESGQGAKFNGFPIRVATYKQVKASIISMDISKNPKLDRITPLLNACRYIRMLGSTASELSLIASGCLDAHVDVRGTIRATDVAAALAILVEAGGVHAVNGVIGGDFPLEKETTIELVAASSRSLLDELLILTKCPTT